MSKVVLITGATSGFGEASAHIFAVNGYDLILTGRRKNRLEKLAAEIEKKQAVDVLSLDFDVREEEAVKQNLGQLQGKWGKIDVLVNNAGLASGWDDIQDGSTEDWDKMIDTNVKGLLYVSKSIVPKMIEQGSGHIINIGSTAGKEVYSKGAVYCASKHAVDALTKGMRIDLLGKGIKVTQIAPGAAETEFAEVRFHGDKERAKKVYEGYQPMIAEDIASLVYYVTTLPPHLCINDLVVTALDQANSFYVNRE
jgi:3-hydroxy acid dehydrogenase/malonic semialdehyde reductase